MTLHNTDDFNDFLVETTQKPCTILIERGFMYKDKEKQKVANRLAAQRQRDKLKGMTPSITQGMTKQGIPIIPDAPIVIPAFNVPGVKPLGLPLERTGSTCDSFETLPLDVQQDIDRLTAWCEQKAIADDRAARIQRAIHYQQYVRAG